MNGLTAKQRKAIPIFSGVLQYFPDAIAAVAECSMAGNEQHNPGKPLHWDRSKSGDELDALARHLMDAGTMDSDGIRHSAKVAWRAFANLQKEIEAENEPSRPSLTVPLGEPRCGCCRDWNRCESAIAFSQSPCGDFVGGVTDRGK